MFDQTHLSFFFAFPVSFQLISLTFTSPTDPSPTQALLESALKHWSGVKCYVALDGSG